MTNPVLPETDHHIVVSADAHCGASVRDYKQYLEAKYHADFDAWAKQLAAEKEWSFAELVRRGLENMVLRQASPPPTDSAWNLPEAVDLHLKEDPFHDEEWREKANTDQPQ